MGIICLKPLINSVSVKGEDFENSEENQLNFKRRRGISESEESNGKKKRNSIDGNVPDEVGDSQHLTCLGEDSEGTSDSQVRYLINF